MTGTNGVVRIEWHDQNVEKLINLHKQGKTAREIAMEFPSLTRSAVLGKLNRLGLSQKKKPKRPIAIPKPKPERQNPIVFKPNSKRVEPKLPAQEPIPENTVGFLEKGHNTCRAVMGYSVQDGHRLPFYCGNLRAEIVPFCPYHCGIYYRKI